MIDEFLEYDNCKTAYEISLCMLKSWHSDLLMGTDYFKPNILKWAKDLEGNEYVKDVYGAMSFTLNHTMGKRNKQDKKDLFDKIKEALEKSK